MPVAVWAAAGPQDEVQGRRGLLSHDDALVEHEHPAIEQLSDFQATAGPAAGTAAQVGSRD